MNFDNKLLMAAALGLAVIMSLVPAFACAQCLIGETSSNDIATNVFRILKEVPIRGLEESAQEIQGIIDIHKRLAKEADPSRRYLSMLIADAVAVSIVTEIHRSVIAETGDYARQEPPVISFGKQHLLDLWEKNMPDFPDAIRMILDEPGTITRFVAESSSFQDVLDGKMIDKAPIGTIRPLIRSLIEKARHMPCIWFGDNPSADERLAYALAKYQAFIDIGIVLERYKNGDLPNDDNETFKSVIAEGMDLRGRRVDDGMNASPLKVWMTFREYHPTENVSLSAYEEYCIRQALTFSPFMTDTGILPERARRVLEKVPVLQSNGERDRYTRENR